MEMVERKAMMVRAIRKNNRRNFTREVLLIICDVRAYMRLPSSNNNIYINDNTAPRLVSRLYQPPKKLMLRTTTQKKAKKTLKEKKKMSSKIHLFHSAIFKCSKIPYTPYK